MVDDVRATWKVSIRRACAVLKTDTSSYHYKSRRSECPINGLPSVRFDFTVSRESEADRRGGRVGADPASMLAST